MAQVEICLQQAMLKNSNRARRGPVREDTKTRDSSEGAPETVHTAAVDQILNSKSLCGNSLN